MNFAGVLALASESIGTGDRKSMLGALTVLETFRLQIPVARKTARAATRRMI
jgi:hypothetical protein